MKKQLKPVFKLCLLGTSELTFSKLWNYANQLVFRFQRKATD